MRLWYLRRGVPWAAVAGCLAAAAVLAAAAWHWPDQAVVLLPFAVASGAGAGGFLLDEAGSAVVRPTPRGGRWADGSRLAALPAIALVVVALVRPAAGAAGLTTTGWGVVSVVAVALGAAFARALRPRWTSPGSLVAVLLVLVTTAPFTVGALLGWTPPWPETEMTGGIAVLWGSLGVGAGLVLGVGLVRADLGGTGSASMAP